MSTNHIFTVNEATFNIHLNYMFAGTGKDGEEHQNGALCDILGVRPGDNVIFYVIKRGFYGLFQIKDGMVFYEHPTNQYLDDKLAGKTLTYRVAIQPHPDGVYSRGVPEWTAIEDPQKIIANSIFNMQWGWIFKKLGGNRGCTAIPNDEYELLKNIITQGNAGVDTTSGLGFSNDEIVTIPKSMEYKGNTKIFPREIERIFTIEREEDLRMFFTSQLGINKLLDKVINPEQNGKVVFIANELICSFGEKKIDLMLITDQNKCFLIELKNSFDTRIDVMYQIKDYARWIASYKRYLTGIIPVIILKEAPFYPKRKARLYKYSSKEDYENNQLSPWYTEQLETIERNKTEFKQINIKNAAPLQYYLFKTDKNSKITNFEEL